MEVEMTGFFVGKENNMALTKGFAISEIEVPRDVRNEYYTSLWSTNLQIYNCVRTVSRWDQGGGGVSRESVLRIPSRVL